MRSSDWRSDVCSSELGRDWKQGQAEMSPGKTMPSMTVVERNYPGLYKQFTSLGPLTRKLGVGGKGINWPAGDECDLLAQLNYQVDEQGVSHGLPRLDTDIDAAETILALAPETNGRSEEHTLNSSH